jgi:hypothetical protein
LRLFALRRNRFDNIYVIIKKKLKLYTMTDFLRQAHKMQQMVLSTPFTEYFLTTKRNHTSNAMRQWQTMPGIEDARAKNNLNFF